jgi:cell wall assembly regulator SMI1
MTDPLLIEEIEALIQQQRHRDIESGAPLPGPLDSARLTELERYLGFPVPDELREWLARHNGALVGPGGVFGYRAYTPSLDIATRLDRLPKWKTRRWIPVAGDGSGDYYLIDAGHEFREDDAVYFVDQADFDRPDYLVASGLWTFLLGLLRKELGLEPQWPFEENLVLRLDPRLSLGPAELLPWRVA